MLARSGTTANIFVVKRGVGHSVPIIDLHCPHPMLIQYQNYPALRTPLLALILAIGKLRPYLTPTGYGVDILILPVFLRHKV